MVTLPPGGSGAASDHGHGLLDSLRHCTVWVKAVGLRHVTLAATLTLAGSQACVPTATNVSDAVAAWAPPVAPGQASAAPRTIVTQVRRAFIVTEV